MFLTRAAIAAIVLMLIIPSISLAQEEQMTTDEYKQTVNELKERKTELTEKEESLRNELEYMRGKIDSMKKAYESTMLEIYTMKYGKDDGSRVYHGQIWTGMTDNMLKDSWGEPDRVTKNVEPWGTFTQWYYGDITFFFRDGRLTAWEDKGKEGEGRGN